MKTKPVVKKEYNTSYLDVTVNLVLDYNICFVIGDSGEGKSFLWQILSDDSALVSYLQTYNYRDINKEIDKQIMEAKGKLIVIDNTDILLSSKLRQHIAFDTNNQYILFGRNPESLFLTKENFKEIRFNDRTIYLENAFD